MNVAFVSTGRDLGGVIAYNSRLMIGLKKLGHECSHVFITKGNGKTSIENYRKFGEFPNTVCKNTQSIISTLNHFDLIVHEMPGGFNDIRHYRDHGFTSMPWFYEGLCKVHKPQTAFLLDTGTLTKWCPYIGVWESNICKFFISIKTGLSELYTSTRGALDVYTIDVPISIDETDISRFGRRPKTIMSTNRVYPEKRLHFLTAAMKQLPDWNLELRSGRFFYYYAKQLEEDMPLNAVWFKDTSIDYEKYYDAALTYAASYFGTGSDGGMECVTLEGAVRGAVPLLSDNWVAPNLDSPPEDLVYKFSISGRRDSNLLDVISNIDPCSKDYIRRQKGIFQWIKTHKRDTVQAKKLHWLYKEILHGKD